MNVGNKKAKMFLKSPGIKYDNISLGRFGNVKSVICHKKISQVIKTMLADVMLHAS